VKAESIVNRVRKVVRAVGDASGPLALLGLLICLTSSASASMWGWLFMLPLAIWFLRAPLALLIGAAIGLML
jgi:hypothetical protein